MTDEHFKKASEKKTLTPAQVQTTKVAYLCRSTTAMSK